MTSLPEQLLSKIASVQLWLHFSLRLSMQHAVLLLHQLPEGRVDNRTVCARASNRIQQSVTQ